jgi:hypothetical protein
VFSSIFLVITSTVGDLNTSGADDGKLGLAFKIASSRVVSNCLVELFVATPPLEPSLGILFVLLVADCPAKVALCPLPAVEVAPLFANGNLLDVLKLPGEGVEYVVLVVVMEVVVAEGVETVNRPPSSSLSSSSP